LSSIVVAATLTVAATPASTAEDLSGLTRALVTGQDFRLRVTAALSLGKTHSKAAIAPLVSALDDPHPAVRAAAAAALGVLGDRSAVGALKVHLDGESSASVKAQIRTAIDVLSASGAERSARMLVKLGQMRVGSNVRNGQLVDVFRGATRARAAELPGVEVLSDASEEDREALRRRLPVIVIDGTLNRLAQGSQGSNVTVSAQVEYVIRKSPEHALKGSVTGAAQALGAMQMDDHGRVAALELEALQGAIESAMRGAPAVMQQALR
jgi:HEAT repeat protein